MKSIFFIILVIIAVLASRQFIKQRREAAVNAVAAVRSIAVQVKDKRATLSPNRRSRQREVIPVEDWRYEAWFQPLDGANDIKLRLQEQDYQRIDKGQTGQLKVQGTQFISFSANP